jgi:NTE family protein
MPNADQADLVLEGGGVKGLGLVGAVGRLLRQGYSFPRVAGTSAGRSWRPSWPPACRPTSSKA